MPQQREAYEETLGRLRRRLRTLYQCTNALFQAESEQALLRSICEILVAGGEIRPAWGGYCEGDAGKTVRPPALARDGGGPEGPQAARGGQGNRQGAVG